MQELLKLFLKRLVQLDAGNRSLFLPKLSQEKDIDIHEMDFALGKPSFHIIELLIANKPIRLCPVTDSRDSTNSSISARLKKIVRKEKSISEETGAQDLYVGYPFVQGLAPGGLSIHCPLLFFPVELEQKDNLWILNSRNDEPVELNKSFLLAYAHFFQTTYDEELSEIDFREIGGDALEFRTALYELLKKSKLEINFNQDLFKNKLQYFSEYPKREDFIDLHPEGLLKLFPEAVLGIFPQAGSFLEPDYQWLLENVSIESLEKFFELHQHLPLSDKHNTQEPRTNQFIQLVKEEQTFTPFKIDIFQENAIKAVKYGQSMVVQGPPGTGKSQLISNLAADFMARGKNVLIVCQKRAALDVVKKRLSEAGIGDFVSLVHDFKFDRKGIFAKIDDQISKLEEYKSLNYKLDTVFLERQFQQASRRIDNITEELEHFRTALYDSSICGINPKELYNQSNPNNPAVPIPEFKKFPFNTWEGFKRTIKSLFRYHKLFGAEDYIWNQRISFSKFSNADKLELVKLLGKIHATSKGLLSTFSSWTKNDVSVSQLHSLSQYIPAIQSILEGMANPSRKKYVFISPNPRLSKKKIDKMLTEWQDKKNNGLKSSVGISQIEDYLQKIQLYEASQQGLFKKLKWALFSPDKKPLQALYLSEGIMLPKKDFGHLKTRLLASKEFHELNSSIISQTWGSDFPKSLDASEVFEWFNELKLAIELKDQIGLLIDENPIFQNLFKNPSKVKAALASLIEINSLWQEYLKSWSTYLSFVQIENLISDKELSSKMEAVLQADFDNLVEFDQLTDSLLPHELEASNSLLESGNENPIELFENSIQLEWLTYLEEIHPILRSVSTFKVDDLTQELQEKINEKQQLSRDIVIQNVRERVYRNTTFNRLNNMVTYRELQHQVSKKKKIWPLRKVLNEYHEEVFNLMPCWLASPESVSAIFPMEEWFDLVIFDEASQCFAEKGLPAMFRAKQIVVTGDSQQLQPNDLYQVRWDNPEDESFDGGVDSLLDLCARYLPQVQLSEHYRSKNPSLIGFSNEHFYKNTLRMVPFEEVFREKKPAIQFVHVDGIWENNSNRIEAEHVVRLVFDLIRLYPEKELGIVTFNFRQQNLILDLLEQESILQKILIPETLIVKNIENIQGDEKDIIIFSIGYAADLKGKLIMNFGSLNADGGQNRLNVAITRAKEQVFVVASILPQQLIVEDAKHEGPRLLKKYLSYVVNGSNFTDHMDDIYQKPNSWLNGKLSDHFSGQRGLQPISSLRFADFAIQSNKETLILLTDDNRYFSSLSSKDLHGYFLQRLQEKNWNYNQLFARNFWLNFNDAVNKIELRGN